MAELELGAIRVGPRVGTAGGGLRECFIGEGAGKLEFAMICELRALRCDGIGEVDDELIVSEGDGECAISR